MWPWISMMARPRGVRSRDGTVFASVPAVVRDGFGGCNGIVGMMYEDRSLPDRVENGQVVARNDGMKSLSGAFLSRQARLHTCIRGEYI